MAMLSALVYLIILLARIQNNKEETEETEIEG
jgi:hypothetical protein